MSAQVTAEDAAICESVQRNLASGAYKRAGSAPATRAAWRPSSAGFARRSTAPPPRVNR